MLLLVSVLATACSSDSPSGTQCSGVQSVTVTGLPAIIPALTAIPLVAEISPSSCSGMAVTWTASAGLTIVQGNILSAEEFGGPHTVTATAGGVSGSTQVAVGTPSVITDNRWAISWMEDASSAMYEVTQSGYPYAYSSSGAIRSTRSGVGAYAVTFVGLAPENAPQRETIQISAYGPNPRRCNIHSWSYTATDLVANVRCWDFTGAAADSRFDILVAPAGSMQGRSAFFLTPSATGGAISPATTHNSSGNKITYTRTATGRYLVTLHGLRDADVSGSGAEIFHVTAYGSGSEWCKPSAWEDTSNGLELEVRCFTATGAPADARFSAMLFERGRYLKRLGFVWANTPTSTVLYTPPLAHNYSSATGPNTSIQTSTGVFSVGWPGLGRPADIYPETNLVTAFGSDNLWCQVGSWGATSLTVRCFAADGSPANAQFTAVWVE